MATYRARSSRKRSGRLVKVALLLVVVAAVLAGLELTNTTHFFHKPVAKSGTIPSTSPSATIPASTAKSTSSSTAAPTTNSSPKLGNNTSTAMLIAPYGNFVSNHSPDLSGSPHPSAEESVCNTSPGATCYIKFTMGDVVKVLESQTADGSGAVYWKWDVKQAGFTAGKWQITAVASLNGQEKTADDNLGLEVGP